MRLIVTLAAWTWTLESVSQLDFAIAHSIRGAANYRTALQKHSTNGKALVQADTRAPKAGQEYVLAVMKVITCEKDIHELKDLIGRYTGEAALYAAARARFYDSILSMQTSAVLTQTVSSRDLPGDFGPSIISGLQSQTHGASFILIPSTDPASDHTFASIFTDGLHFHAVGLQAYLRGARPRPENVNNGVYRVNLNISTSGLYADIQEGKVFYFTRGPQSARVSYDITTTGEIREIHINRSFEDEVHAYPTLFTKWTVELLDCEQLDLIDLVWRVYARLD